MPGYPSRVVLVRMKPRLIVAHISCDYARILGVNTLRIPSYKRLFGKTLNARE